MSRRSRNSGDSESRKRTFETSSRSANFHGSDGSMERVQMTRRSTASSSYGSSTPRVQIREKPAKVCRSQRELRSLADSLCSSQPLQRTRTASIRATFPSRNPHRNNEASSDEENKEELVSTISIRRKTRRFSQRDCSNKGQTKRATLPDVPSPSNESTNELEQAQVRRITRSSAIEVASSEGVPPSLDSTDDESQTSSTIQNIRPILKKQSLRDRLSVFTRSSARLRVVSFRDTVSKGDSIESEHSSHRFPRASRPIRTQYQSHGRGSTELITRSMVRGGETTVDTDERRMTPKSESTSDDIPGPESHDANQRIQRVSRKRSICSSLNEVSIEDRHLESPREPRLSSNQGSIRTVAKTRSLVRASGSSEPAKTQAAAQKSTKSEAKTTSEYESDAESAGSKRRSRRVSYGNRCPSPFRVAQTEVEVSVTPRELIAAKSKESTHSAVKTRSMLKVYNNDTPTKSHKEAASLKKSSASERRVTSDDKSEGDEGGKHRRLSLRRQSPSSKESTTVMKNGPDVVRTRSMGRTPCDVAQEPLNYESRKPAVRKPSEARGTKRKYTGENAIPRPGKGSCFSNSHSRTKPRTQSPIRYASKLVRDDARRPIVRCMPLLMDYDSRAQKGLDYERVDFGATWENVPKVIQRTLHHLKKPEDDPDILMDERQYKLSLRSHRHFEDQEKLIALDDDDYQQSHARSYSKRGNDSDDLASRPIVLACGVRSTRSTKSLIAPIGPSQPPERIIPLVRAIEPIRPESSYEALVELNQSIEFAIGVNKHHKS